MKIGQQVTFSQGDDANTVLWGIITRVWPNGRTLTIKAEGKIPGTTRTFVRDIDRVCGAS